MSKYTIDRAIYMHSYIKRSRYLVVGLLGGICVKCGFKDIRALQIDHVDGGGSQARKTKGTNYSEIARDIKNGSKKYQLLCANCNWIKRDENNESTSHFSKLKYEQKPKPKVKKKCRVCLKIFTVRRFDQFTCGGLRCRGKWQVMKLKLNEII